MHHIRELSLGDKYSGTVDRAYMTGIQALVRAVLDRARLDRLAGHHTGGFVSGYRGSPLAGLDQQLAAVNAQLKPLDIHFRPGVNEELAATAVWGSQKTALAGKGSDFDGVFGLWYGKAPGVDRAGDVLKHANASGTDALGGVVAVAGDDHTAKSSSMPAQSEFAFQDAEIPILNPADLQDALDLAILGFDLSRYSGLWTGLIALADTMDSSAVIEVDLARHRPRRPEDNFDPRIDHQINRNLTLADRLELEKTLRHVRLPAAQAFAAANRLDRVGFGATKPRLGLVATGKAYRDLRQALSLVGLDEKRARQLGLGLFKVTMSWPLEPGAVTGFAQACDRLMVVEHRRPVLEPQLKTLAYHWPADQRPQMWGKERPDGSPFLSQVYELSSVEMISALIAFMGRDLPDDIASKAAAVVKRAAQKSQTGIVENRIPFFCSGCPHSRSTKVPDGARAMPGIGCHAMAASAGNITDGLVAMGGEGVPWVGAQPFSRDTHMFVNLGDGTYYHSGLLAIRQAVAARTPMTYKILYNDAVAMTGGQPHDGPLSVPQMTRQLAAEGVERIVVISERPELYTGTSDLAENVQLSGRDDLMVVQKELARFEGVSALIYDQTCAAEKRRRRKKGLYPAPTKRIFINPRVCEACGDCSQQSSCLSVEPLATSFGTKREINQSTCNFDASCADGFCPSFVHVEGAQPASRRDGVANLAALVVDLPPVTLPPAENCDTLITGIGGAGVTTTAALLAMAGHIDGLNATTLDMTGLAQKGGPVTSHVRFAAFGAPIETPRIPPRGASLVLAGDLLVAASVEARKLMSEASTRLIGNSGIAPTAHFALRQSPGADPGLLTGELEKAVKSLTIEDIAGMAERIFGDALFANTSMIGAAWQMGLLPMSSTAIEAAIRLNGVAIDDNLAAFNVGRVIAVDSRRLFPDDARSPRKMTLDQRITFLSDELCSYHNRNYADDFRRAIRTIRAADKADGDGSQRLSEIAAEQLFKVMAIKDEYEVARLYTDPQFLTALRRQFGSYKSLKIALAPPFLSRPGPDGRPGKRLFGGWVLQLFKLLAPLRILRNTPFDPFGRTSERHSERELLATYRSDLALIGASLGTVPYDSLCRLAAVPDSVRGFGPIKVANLSQAQKVRQQILSDLAEGEAPHHSTTALEAAE